MKKEISFKSAAANNQGLTAANWEYPE